MEINIKNGIHLKYQLKVHQQKSKRKLKNGDVLENIYYFATLPRELAPLFTKGYLYFYRRYGVVYINNRSVGVDSVNIKLQKSFNFSLPSAFFPSTWLGADDVVLLDLDLLKYSDGGELKGALSIDVLKGSI